MKLTGHLRQAKEQGFAKFDTLVAVFLFGILALFLWPIASRLDGTSLKILGGLFGFIVVLGLIRDWIVLSKTARQRKRSRQEKMQDDGHDDA